MIHHLFFSREDSIESISDGSKIELDNEIKAQAIYTPGHNPSCITWIIKDCLLQEIRIYQE